MSSTINVKQHKFYHFLIAKVNQVPQKNPAKLQSYNWYGLSAFSCYNEGCKQIVTTGHFISYNRIGNHLKKEAIIVTQTNKKANIRESIVEIHSLFV